MSTSVDSVFTLKQAGDLQEPCGCPTHATSPSMFRVCCERLLWGRDLRLRAESTRSLTVTTSPGIPECDKSLHACRPELLASLWLPCSTHHGCFDTIPGTGSRGHQRQLRVQRQSSDQEGNEQSWLQPTVTF